ncbi:acetylcholine receptor subunit alpha-like 1 isoform X1 [Solenopsis invicta]|uniref:acetylcholine receptor subunit alpha-like 1 isoform X1 n=1 Tax=Solenopsis invicta TaxID=13686 RepID=UPI000E33DD9B|nr:acetylcholine receptor subunit alpha-like 1 isoform X1 [Solenopsis invicta]XP_039306573.1 acetylcholine receptor subunit alpha-like 1 isoform X1 [Solenopsis invicta]
MLRDAWTNDGGKGWWRWWSRLGGLLAMAAAISCLVAPFPGASANPEAKRLYDDLLSNYNRLIRPVGNNSDRLTVKMGLRLSQLIEVNLKNQIMTTNVWVEQEWNDYKLKWNPDEYGGVETLHVPSEHIWLPDIVLYNNADGNYEVTIMTKAILNHTGKVTWKPPAVYKSFCEIDVEYFPFDEQTCFMKFGSWTYDGYTVDLQHLLQTEDSNQIEVGIDLTDYYISVEWDILKVPATRNEAFYICCEEPYPDIVFNITLRRKTLFYLVNLIIPCVGISFLSVLVFYLPSDSGEKVSLSISILLSLTVFFLLLAEIIPPTSLTVPLLGKYLLFTMVMVTASVVVTIAVLNVNFRSPVTHRMANWVRVVFIQVLPPFLFIKRPKKTDDYDDEDQGRGGDGISTGDIDDDGVDDDDEDDDDEDDVEAANGKPPEGILTDVFHVPETDKYDTYYGKRFSGEYEVPPHGLPPPATRYDLTAVGTVGTVAPCFEEPLPSLPLPGADDDLFGPASPGYAHEDVSPTFEKPLVREIEKTIDDARFIAQHAKNKDKFESVEEDWKYVAMVLDRIFLWIFTLTCVLGTAFIICQAPALYDYSLPIDIKYSKIYKKKLMLRMGMGPEED